MVQDGRADEQRARLDQQWLHLLLDVALIANEGESLERALFTVLGRVCQHNGWHAGFCHVIEGTRDLWWFEPRSQGSEESLTLEAQRLAKNWARQVMKVGSAQYVDDFGDSRARGFELPGEVPASGGAVAAPLLVGERSVGAMVFFSRHSLGRDLGQDHLASLLEIIDSIGTQMGRVVERWHLSRRIAEEAEREREELGRQIHDGIAQQLVGVKLLAQNLRKRMGEMTDQQKGQWDQLMTSLVEAQNEARAVAKGLSTGALLSSSDTLIGQLEELAEVVRTGHGVECSVRVKGSISLHDKLAGANLLRIAREAVMNALRHAQPGRIDIEMRGGRDQVVLEIRDDGSGVSPGDNVATGMGLLGMRYRAAAIGGRMELKSTPGQGTLVRCIV